MKHQTLKVSERLGIAYEDALKLCREAMILTRWGVSLCGNSSTYLSWAVERDPDTEFPYLIRYYRDGHTTKTRVRDTERGALKRITAILSKYPSLRYYHQTDPRGHSLYVYKQEDLPSGKSIEVLYHNIGEAFYK